MRHARSIAHHWRQAASLVVLLALAACGGPDLVPNPESGIELRWPTGQGGMAAAQAEADARCQPLGRRAVLVDTFVDRNETLARFSCR